MNKNIWKKLSLGVILSLAILLVFPFTAFAAEPQMPCPQADWSVVDITVTNQWITNQAGTEDATVWAKSSTDATITVRNNGQPTQVIGNKWINITLENDKGKVQSDGLDTNLDLVITDSNGVKTVIKGASTDFEYSLQAGDEEGMVNICAKFDGKEHIISTLRIFGFPIAQTDYWTCWDDFCKYFCNVFGVDNTSPTINGEIVGHATSSVEWGCARYWTTVNYSAFDELSGILEITETLVHLSGPNHKVLHIITAVDVAGNKTVKEFVTSSSWAGPSIHICEHCWHSLYCGDAKDDWKIQSVFAPGGWYYYTCPFCGYSSEKEQRERYKLFVDRGGYVPIGDFDKGLNYKP